MSALIACVATIVAAIDADTFDARCDDGRAVRLRIHGIDAAEVRGAACEAERAEGIRAARAAAVAWEGRLVRLRPVERDRYGRQVDNPDDGADGMAAALVGAGLARRWDYDGGEAKPDWCAGK